MGQLTHKVSSHIAIYNTVNILLHIAIYNTGNILLHIAIYNTVNILLQTVKTLITIETTF